MRALLTILVLAAFTSACVTSSPLDGLEETEPVPPTTEADQILAAALAHAVANPDASLASLAAPSRVPVGSEYHVRDGDGWAPRPYSASALPAATEKAFVLVSDEEAYARATTEGRFSWVTLSLDAVSADTAIVYVGRRTFYSSPGEARRGLRPGFGASGSARIGRFVRSGTSWEFDQWTGWIGS